MTECSLDLLLRRENENENQTLYMMKKYMDLNLQVIDESNRKTERLLSLWPIKRRNGKGKPLWAL